MQVQQTSELFVYLTIVMPTSHVCL